MRRPAVLREERKQAALRAEVLRREVHLLPERLAWASPARSS